MNSFRKRWMILGLAGLLAVSVAGGTVATTYANGRVGAVAGQMGMRGEWGRGEHLATIAEALGMSEADLLTALQSGKSVAAIAEEKGVALSKVVDALVAEQSAQLKEAVSAGRLTQAQADARLAAIKEQLPTMLSQNMGPGMIGGRMFDRRGPGFGMGLGESLPTISATLGMTETEVISAVREGQSIAEIAAEQQIDLNKIVDALVAEQSTALKQAVTEGRLTQAQADQQLATLKANLPHLLSLKGGMGFGFGPHGFGMGGGRGWRNGGPAAPAAPADENAAPEQQDNRTPAAPAEGGSA